MSLPERGICVDVQGAQNSAHLDRGIPRFIVEHAKAFAAHEPTALHSVLASPERPLTGNLNWLLGKGLLGWTTDDRRSSPRPNGRPLLYHVMSPFELDRTLDELWPQWARNPTVKTVVTLYDLIPLVFEEHYLRDPVIRERYLARTRLVSQADHVLAISQTTAEDAVERLGVHRERITVIDAGAASMFAGMYRSRVQAERVLAGRFSELKAGFMLYVAGFEFRKNLERLIAAYGLLPEQVRAEHQLVIACRLLPSEADLLHGLAKEAGIAPGQLVLSGYVTDRELGALYHACALFVFASFYEGSGLPILEAMSCGAPVIASHTATGPEILGDLEGTFDPFDPPSIATCMQEVLGSSETLKRLVDRSRTRVGAYTWEHVAEQTSLAYERTLAGRTPGPRRQRLALVTPWPPERSGIADYSYRLATELARTVDVDVIVSEPISAYAPPLEEGVSLLEASAFAPAHSVRQHDRILYCMGNSSFHRHVYELLRVRPGAVIAHDVRLTGFYGWFAGIENPGDPTLRLLERIKALYGERIPDRRLERAPDPQLQSALGIFMTREIQQYSEALFVHSHFAADVLQLDRGAADREVPVTVAPFGMPDAGPPSDGVLGEHPLIVSVGVVSEVKGLAELITACGLLSQSHPGIRLVIAGDGEESELERWRAYAREHAPLADVRLPGHTPQADFDELLRNADLAVQLRTVSNGEASAAVADCLAAGLPTIVNALGWAAELPEGVVDAVAPGADANAIAERMRVLLDSGPERSQLANRAREHALANSFRSVAETYVELLELL